MLRSALSDDQGTADGLYPWEDRPYALAPAPGRLSATDSLSWWFRPVHSRAQAWDDYFATAADPAALAPAPPPALKRATGVNNASIQDEPPPKLTPWISLRLLLAEPEEELLDEEADSVVECLYRFIHAIGREDVTAAMDCVAEDFHTLEEEQELDRRGLERKIRFMLDALRGWEFDISLIEIPQPILHPDGILVYTETLIDAFRETDEARQSTLERRLAFFARQADGNWLMSAFPTVEWPGR